jgi:hypothetical protein
MNIEDLAHPSWEERGWVRSKVTVHLFASGERHGIGALTHADAPGLALVGYEFSRIDPSNVINFTHVSTGMDTGLLYYGRDCPPCPVALRDAAKAACEVIDYATITLSEARSAPAWLRERARAPFRDLNEHECEACAWWHDTRVPVRIEAAEREVAEWRDAVASAEDALSEAENNLHLAIETRRFREYVDAFLRLLALLAQKYKY